MPSLSLSLSVCASRQELNISERSLRTVGNPPCLRLPQVSNALFRVLRQGSSVPAGSKARGTLLDYKSTFWVRAGLLVQNSHLLAGTVVPPPVETKRIGYYSRAFLKADRRRSWGVPGLTATETTLFRLRQGCKFTPPTASSYSTPAAE